MGGARDNEPLCELLRDDQEDGVNNAGRSSVTAGMDEAEQEEEE
jgi:hypothetical protein